MKTTRDFDLSFRPETYWEHGDPIAAILSDIKGKATAHGKGGARNATHWSSSATC